MITLYNPNVGNPFSVQYVYGAQVFRKEILPGYICGFRNLTETTQIVNLQSLTGNNITVYDANAATFVNQASSFVSAYRGFVTATGITFTTALLTTPTGYTFTTSASTATTLSNDSVSAVTFGNDVYVQFSGNPTTGTWLTGIQGTSFSGLGITTAGHSSVTTITTASTTVVSLSSNTVSTTAGYYLYVGNNKKREEVLLTAASAFSAATSYVTLRALVTGSTAASL